MNCNYRAKGIILLCLFLFSLIVGNIPHANAVFSVSNKEVTILDMDCGNWLFAQEKYYTFNAVFEKSPGATFDTVAIAFNDSAAIHEVLAYYDSVEGTWSLSSNSQEAALLKSGSVSAFPNNITVTFLIYLKSSILDTSNVDIYMFCNLTDGTKDDWENKASNYFNIYNLGGLAFVTTTGANSGRAAFADIFAVYCGQSSSVRTEQYWKNLKHYGLLINIWIDNVNQWQRGTEQPVAYYWGLDYYYEGAWVKGLTMRIYGPIPLSYLQGDHYMAVWNVTWYYKGVGLKSGTIATYPLAVATSDTSANTNMFVDLWFNRMNGSTLMGSRVGAEYTPMKDASDSFWRWATGSSWGANVMHPQQKAGFQELLDSSGEQFSSKALTFMRMWCNITQGNNVHVAQMVMWKADINANSRNMEGIDTPNQPDVKTPHMPQGGFFGALLSVLQGVWQVLCDFMGPVLLDFWEVFVGFLDTVAGVFGFPNGFSILIADLQASWTWFVTSFSDLILLLNNLFTFLGSTLTNFVDILGQLLTSLSTTLTYFLDLMSGGIGTAGNLWNEWGISTWITVALVFYPMYLLLLWESQGADAVIQQLGWIFGLMAWLISLFISIIHFSITLISTIVEAIPIAE